MSGKTICLKCLMSLSGLHVPLPFAAAQVQVSSPVLSITEGAANTFCVDLSATDGAPDILENSLTVTLSTVTIGGTAGITISSSFYFVEMNIIISLAEPSDFSLPMTTITIPPGPIPNPGPDCASVMAIDDMLAEGPETFDIVITATNQPEVSVGTSDTTTVTINDNEGMYVSVGEVYKNHQAR